MTLGWRLGPVAGAWLVAGALAACEDDAVRPTVNVTAADTADQVLFSMEHLITSNGVRRTRVLADTAYLYEQTQLARLKTVTVSFYDAVGNESSTIKADSGTYQMRDGSMQSWGRVLATTPDGRRLRSEELKYDARQHKISSDRPFTYDRGDQHLEGNGFTSDPDFRNVVAQQPRGGQVGGPTGRPDSASGGFRLPGQ
jgi:LPS export ABC transporter protein LptC